MVSYHGMQIGFSFFLVGEFGAFEIFIRNDCLQSLIFHISVPWVWQSFVTIGSCNHLMRIISTYVGNTKKSEIS